MLTASTAYTAITEITHKYIFDNTDFLWYLLVAVTVDLIAGIAKAYAKEGIEAITSKGIRMTVLKFIQYGSFLIITHVLASVQFGGTDIKPFEAVEKWAYTLLLLIEIKSVYENLIAINHKLDFIKVIIARINVVIKSQKDSSDPPTKTT